MADVVDFPVRVEAEVLVFVCDCGCSTFLLRSDGETECASCSEISSGDGGGWSDHLQGAGDVADGVEIFVDIQDGGSVDFARASAARRAGGDDRVMIMSVGSDGGVSVWAAVDTVERRDWALRRLDEMRTIIEGMI
jgi:hypothetical protein